MVLRGYQEPPVCPEVRGASQVRETVLHREGQLVGAVGLGAVLSHAPGLPLSRGRVPVVRDDLRTRQRRPGSLVDHGPRDLDLAGRKATVDAARHLIGGDRHRRPKFEERWIVEGRDEARVVYAGVDATHVCRVFAEHDDGGGRTGEDVLGIRSISTALSVPLLARQRSVGQQRASGDADSGER